MIGRLPFPGVSAEEPRFGGGPIKGVATSVTGFVGFAPEGPVGRPLRVESPADFARRFGRPQAAGPLAVAVRLFFENGGREARVVRVPPEGSALAKRPSAKPLIADLHALDELKDLNLLVIPDTAAMSRKAAAAVAKVAVSYAEERRALYLIDPPRAGPGADPVQSSLAWLAATPGLRHRNAALYLPGLRVPDPVGGQRCLRAGPSGAVAGLYARIDGSRGVWQAPAGPEARLTGLAGLDGALGEAERERLMREGVNVLVETPEWGIVSSSARTLEPGPAGRGEWRYVNLRRLLLFVEESIQRGTAWAAFEPKGEALWARLRFAVSSFMHPLFRRGALRGRRPEEAYFIRCGRDTMTEQDLAAGRIRIHIGLAPLRPAEFVILEVIQNTRPTC